ncbi:unnamed protein product [Arctia plantaginis]|uniref:DNA helicase MCM9 n=1 Tax=Arctia plantaginis TaxID=874455 RepID=A0A8S1B135_ARCPL|nr:unnamed protein product [Arctia plantaginis]
MILEYIIKFHLQECINILSQPDKLGYYSVKIDFLKLFETYPDVGDKVLCDPVVSLPACDKDVIKAQQQILEGDEYKSILSKLQYSFIKRNVHARFFGLPVCPELHRTIFPKNVDLGCFLKVTGTVVRVTQSKMLEYHRKYVCVKCNYENCQEAQFENRYILKPPSKCGNDIKSCRSSTFSEVQLVSREHCKDYQEIKIQEQVNKLSIGTIPGSLWVVLEDDLVDCCKPGDDVLICATVRRRWRPVGQNKKSEVELVPQANYIEVCNAQRSEVIATAPDIKECFNEFWAKYEACPLKGRDRILAAVAPQVYGLHLVKLALLLTVITGSNHIIENDINKKTVQDEKHSTRVRGQCHLLLVGDPGTGKSQLLRVGSELTARSVFTSGAGSTRAGLTCAALREDGEWHLEAGALVLSDGGVCCIDEISQLRVHDRTAIHEAMEQQTISVAKAGIVCKLNTRCAIIAACNPKGHYDTDQPLSVNVSLGTPLLSRFDLIFILLDSKNKTWDKLVSSYILFGDSNASESKKWNLEKLQMYIDLVGPRFTEMTKSANMILQSYYMLQRRSEHRDPSRTTVRMLDSLVRLSQAHCRLMYRTTILPMDAIIAITLVDLSMQDCTLDDTTDALHSTIPKYSDYEYLQTAKKLLTQLNLLDIWRNELLYYAKLLQVDHKTLENDLENGNCKIFAKHEDVTDDNIQLSASLITSSYFHNNKNTKKVDVNLVDDTETSTKKDKNFKSPINERLAATLKKHAALNKTENEPTTKKKNINKRKRKEITADTSLVKRKLIKKGKKSKDKTDGDHDYICNSDEEFDDNVNMLNVVPSVNDALADLGIDFRFESDTNDNNRNENMKTESEENEMEVINVHRDKASNSGFNKQEVIDKRAIGSNNKTEVQQNTANKLKQFQFVSNHDPDKYEEKSHKVIDTSSNKLTRLELEHEKDIFKSASKSKTHISMFETSVKTNTTLKENNPNSSSSNKVLNSGSQISIFESSDCDIDLDI